MAHRIDGVMLRRMSRIRSLAIISHGPSPASEQPAVTPLLLTPRDAAKLLSVSEKTLHRLSAPNGSIPVVRIGKRGVRYTAAALNQWIADQQAASLNNKNVKHPA